MTVTPTSTDVSGKTVTYTYQWLQNGKAIAKATSATLTLTALTLDVGDAISVKITPKDSSKTGTTFISKALTVATPSPITFNLPTVTSVVIAPNNAPATTQLTATPTSSDPYGNSVTYAYQWVQNGTAIPGATSETLTLSSVSTISIGDTFSVMVTPRDGLITGAAFTSNTVSIATTTPITLNGPVVTSVVISSRTTSLTATPASTDPNGETVTYSYQWLDNGTPIPGATDQNLDLNNLTVSQGDLLTVQVTPADASSKGATFTSSAVTVATTSPITVNLPTVTSVVITPDNATNTIKLTATPASGSDPYGNTVTYTYQWLHNGNAIAGATGQTLTLTAVGTIAAGDTFSVEVTPSDGIAVGAAFTSHPVSIATASPITLTGPTVTSVLISTDNPSNTTTLTATPTSTDPNGETVTYTYQWLQNGNAINGATGQSLDLSTLTFVAGDLFTVQVTPSDATIAGAAFNSDSATVASNSPPVTFELPTVSAVAIVPNSATSATLLTANSASTDPYGRTVSFTYQWLQNGTVIPGATGRSLDLTQLTINPNDVFTVQVTPNDGTVIGATTTSGNVTVTSVGPVVLGLPVVDSVSILPDDATNVTTLTATPTSHDDSGNSTITYSYQWLLNGTAIVGATARP